MDNITLSYKPDTHTAPKISNFWTNRNDGELPVRFCELGETPNANCFIVVLEEAYTGTGKTFYNPLLKLNLAIVETKPVHNFPFSQSRPSFYESTAVTDEVSITESVLNQIYQLVELGNSAKAVKVAFARIESSLARRDLNAVNEFLTKANVELLSVRVLVAMLRSSSRAKATLYPWKSLLERSISKADQEGLNTERLFWGLK